MFYALLQTICHNAHLIIVLQETENHTISYLNNK